MRRCPLCRGPWPVRKSEHDYRGEGPHDRCASMVALAIALELRSGDLGQRYLANVLLRTLPTKLMAFDDAEPREAYTDAPLSGRRGGVHDRAY